MGEEEALLEGKSYLCLGSISLKRMDPAVISSIDRWNKRQRSIKAVTETEIKV